MVRRSFLCMVTLLLVGCGGSGEIDRRLVAQGRPIYYGEVDDSAAHMAVVAITNGPGTGYFCSGTLISPNFVLTAGHCLQGQSAYNVEVFFGANAYSSGTYREAAELLVHPYYDHWQILNDIALIRLESTAPVSVSPIPYLPSGLGLTRSDEGATVDFSGFGLTETGSDGTKLHVEQQIDRVCTGPSSCGSVVPHAFEYSQSGGGPCSGDSGGPAFIFRSGTEYVAGVTSYGDQFCTDYGVSTTVSDFEPFISDYVGGSQGSPCTSAAECDSGYCVDGVCCDSACSGVCQACNLAPAGTCQSLPNGTPCPDGNLCNGDEQCLGGQCTDGTPLDCSNANLCTQDRCDPVEGCIHDPVPDGTACPNGDACDGQETCIGGVCQAGTPPVCEDANPCTRDGCVAATGCVHPNEPDGTSCGDDLCRPATCTGGTCVQGEPVDCDDEDPCTRDTCDPGTGCVYEPLPDGWECGKCRMCVSGACEKIPDCDIGGCGCHGLNGPGSSQGGGGGGGSSGHLLFLFLLLAMPALRGMIGSAIRHQ